MESLDSIFASAISSGQLPGGVIAASSADGTFNYLKAFGHTSSDLDSPALSTDATFFIASATKLLTAIAALQCVDRGLLTLDEDVSRVLIELRGVQVLKGWDDEGGPILEEANTKISLRMLLNYTSGMAYDFASQEVQKYLEFKGERPSFFDPKLVRPLLFEPGKGWSYSHSPDWVGIMMKRLTGSKSLDSYMEENIWAPLGMTSSTFRIADRPDVAARLPQMAARSPEGTLIKGDAEYFQKMSMGTGGAGMYSSAEDYLKVLTALLRNDGKLLSKENVRELSRPQIKDPDYMAHDRNKPILGDVWPKGVEVQRNWGLGGLINMEDLPWGRKKGSLMWFGVGMMVCWLDPESKVGGFFGSQLWPGDPQVIDLNAEFEKAVYATLKGKGY